MTTDPKNTKTDTNKAGKGANKKNSTSAWDERINEFSTLVGVEPNKVTEALNGVVGEPGDEALALLSNSEAASDQEIKDALKILSIPSAKLNLHLAKLRGADAPKNGQQTNMVSAQLSPLPEVPNEERFLQMLKTGGVLKVSETEVISAVKSAFGAKIDLFSVPDKFVKMMEAHAETLEEPVGEDYWIIQKQLTRERYGDVLSAIGIPGDYVSAGRKKEFLQRIEDKFWPALYNFHQALLTWQSAWMGNANNNMMAMIMIASQSGSAMPQGVMAPPDTSNIQANAEGFINEMNRIFAGAMGVPVSRALAFDADRIMKILINDNMPKQIGASNRDEMLKKLNIFVGSDMVRTEQNVSRYALSIMNLPNITSDQELTYLLAMFQLGSGISWDKIGLRAGGSSL